MGTVQVLNLGDHCSRRRTSGHRKAADDADCFKKANRLQPYEQKFARRSDS